MTIKRFSKLLLGVLALALWAGTAYGQNLTVSQATWNQVYTIGSEQSLHIPIGVTAAANSTQYSVASSVTWLTCTGGTGTANIAPGEQFTLAVVPSGADLLGAGPQTA